MIWNTDLVEALELEFPLRVGYYRLRRDSGGPGRWRGGVGFEKSFEVLRGAVAISHRGERHITAPWGLFGGGPGQRATSQLIRSGGAEEKFASKAELRLLPGDVLKVWTTGGGGYGDPLKRDPAGVLTDVLDGKVSVDAARDSYGVVVVERHVDEAATATERQHAAATRGKIDWTYDRGELGHE